MARKSSNIELFAVPSFSKEAKPLRQHFESRFANPLVASPDRFVWDYWNVPDQYLALRTPAYEYFPKSMYKRFHEQLVLWGRRTLGCHDISPPWLSLYINGCHQTLLLKPDTLSYWESFKPGARIEQSEILRKVPPLFNQLTVFDPRIPHSVARVDGTLNPLEGRLVIHGWFTNPRPYIEGPVSTTELQKHMQSGWLERISHYIEGQALHGLITLRLTVQPGGNVSRCSLVSCTLRSTGNLTDLNSAPFSTRSLIKHMSADVLEWKFKKQKTSSEITLPLQFSP